jgi:hypothetical protein
MFLKGSLLPLLLDSVHDCAGKQANLFDQLD